jgi:hypothetical protein
MCLLERCIEYADSWLYKYCAFALVDLTTYRRTRLAIYTISFNTDIARNLKLRIYSQYIPEPCLLKNAARKVAVTGQ